MPVRLLLISCQKLLRCPINNSTGKKVCYQAEQTEVCVTGGGCAAGADHKRRWSTPRKADWALACPRTEPKAQASPSAQSQESPAHPASDKPTNSPSSTPTPPQDHPQI